MITAVKKIISSIIITALIFSALGTITYAEGGSLTVLGDSIATGYGLDDYKPASEPKSTLSWSYLLSEQTGLTQTNLARDGATLSDLNTSMKTDAFKSAAANADLIVISIGANDLIQLAVRLTSPDIQITDPSGISLLLAELAQNVDVIEKELPALLDSLKSGYNELFTTLKALNGNAAIIIETIYNPYEMWNMQIQTYTEVYIMKDLMRGWIGRANDVITSVASEYGIYVADVYTAFQNEQTGKYLYAYCESTSSMMSGDYNADPHPTVHGHAEIFKVYMELISKNTLLQTESTTSAETDPGTTDAITTETDTTVIESTQTDKAEKTDSESTDADTLGEEKSAAIIPAVIIASALVIAAVTAAVLLIIKKNKKPDKNPAEGK